MFLKILEPCDFGRGRFSKKGDILFQAKGSKIEVVYVEKDYENVLPSTLYFILRTNEKINPEYLCWLLKTELLLLYFEKKFRRISIVRAINKSYLVELDIELPEREEQDRMVEIIKSFEEEEDMTLQYLKTKKQYIEESIISKNGVKINEE
ncbi:restriction endonuclease subunit S [uncultured Leptotrichia sp.]|uniref:restriction endonuclease subunit S n=1 Tax=uncultured Leptotrichia sp. TaxID=159271 RepID=UPI0025D9A336|nr:restriction endonuclease subunit S [uncultured Leptotrichia sp.]